MISALILSLETTALHRNGHQFAVELATIVTRGDEAVRVAAFARDITQHKQLEEEAEKRHRAIMDQPGEAYHETDVRGRYIYVSKSYYELFSVPSTTNRAGMNYEDISLIWLSSQVYEGQVPFSSGNTQIGSCTQDIG